MVTWPGVVVDLDVGGVVAVVLYEIYAFFNLSDSAFEVLNTLGDLLNLKLRCLLLVPLNLDCD